MSDNASGWQPDPTGRFEHRYWDGSAWTDHVSNAGVATTDAFTASPSDAAAGAPDSVDDAPGWGDPTATQPTPAADPTSVWPAAPPPPGITPPLGAGSGALAAASAGSKKGFLIGGIALVAVAAVVAGLLLMGGGGNGDGSTGSTDTTAGSIGSGGELPADFEQQLADVYENSMGLPRDKARCLAGKISDAVKSGTLSQDQAMRDIFSYFSDCNIDMSEFNGN
ncbi:MAG: DUF2510 domain-containing protein [Acidimicrobiales bacterium]